MPIFRIIFFSIGRLATVRPFWSLRLDVCIFRLLMLVCGLLPFIVGINPTVDNEYRGRSRSPKEIFYKQPSTSTSMRYSISKDNNTSRKYYSTSYLSQITVLWWSIDIDTLAQEFWSVFDKAKEGSRGCVYCWYNKRIG